MTHQTKAVRRRSTPAKSADVKDPGPALAVAANQPGADPCDVAEKNMPGYVIGDLTSPDQSWLLSHTGTCNYCRGELTIFERVDDLLDRLGDANNLPTPPLPPKLKKQSAVYTKVESPVGPLFVAVSEKGLVEICFGKGSSEAQFRDELEHRGFRAWSDSTAPSIVTRQLDEYFAGKRHQFDLPLDFSGLPPFTKSVLTATAEVPFGQVRSYQDIARAVGRPSATRAVGNALHRNPIPLVVPCHRIVRSDSTLGGYAGGPAVKQQLLNLEGASLF
ncbi:MAG: methylated-DNA--[protein]-cysteine S-methyltransferase [Thermomicrobiales bacterium]